MRHTENRIAVVSIACFLALPIVTSVLISLSPVACPDGQNQVTSKSEEKKYGSNKSEILSCAAEGKSGQNRKEQRTQPQYQSGMTSVFSWTCRWVRDPIAIFTYYILVVTAVLAYYTFRLWKTGSTQASDSKKSIKESARAAAAIEEVAKSNRENSSAFQAIMHKQFRAYIAVDTGVPTCQDGELRFAGAPIMTNTGLTPARKVSHKVKADILDFPPEEGFKFDESAELISSDAVLSPRQQFVMNALVKDKVPIEDLPIIMAGIKKRLFVWGTVTYEDIFGNSWETNFCHDFTFYKAKNREGAEVINVLGYYYRSHNHAT